MTRRTHFCEEGSRGILGFVRRGLDRQVGSAISALKPLPITVGWTSRFLGEDGGRKIHRSAGLGDRIGGPSHGLRRGHLCRAGERDYDGGQDYFHRVSSFLKNDRVN